MDKKDKSDQFPWIAFFFAVQAIIIILFFNPWIEALRWTAIVIISIEAFLLFFLAIPVFLFHITIRRSSWHDAGRHAIKSIINFLSFTWWV